MHLIIARSSLLINLKCQKNDIFFQKEWKQEIASGSN